MPRHHDVVSKKLRVFRLSHALDSLLHYNIKVKIKMRKRRAKSKYFALSCLSDNGPSIHRAAVVPICSFLFSIIPSFHTWLATSQLTSHNLEQSTIDLLIKNKQTFCCGFILILIPPLRSLTSIINSSKAVSTHLTKIFVLDYILILSLSWW
jgi:hypothetical protein